MSLRHTETNIRHSETNLRHTETNLCHTEASLPVSKRASVTQNKFFETLFYMYNKIFNIFFDAVAKYVEFLKTKIIY